MLKDHFTSLLCQYTVINIPGPGSEEEHFSEVFPSCHCVEPCRALCPCVQRSGVPNLEEGVVRPIIECSPACSCTPAGQDSECPNRHVQNGLRYRLQVFRTQAKGFGVRTLDAIPEGSYVCSYAGEVIGIEEARRRVARIGDQNPNYIITLKEGADGVITVDPSGVGGVGRFLNHSCDPNLVMFPVRTECVVPELCLFSRRSILQGAELTFDYSGGDADLPDGGTNSESGRRECLCGTPVCAGWLPFDESVLGV